MILDKIKKSLSNTQTQKAKSPKETLHASIDSMKELQSSLDLSQSLDILEQQIKNDAQLQRKSLFLYQKLHEVRQFLYGSDEQEPKKAEIHEIAIETYKTSFLQLMINNFPIFNFEARKEATQIFNNLIKLKMNNTYATVDYILSDHENQAIVFTLIEMCGNGQFCTLAGSMLRECIKHEKLAEFVLYSDHFYLLFDFVDHTNFEIASDAFITLKDILSRHKTLYATYMETHFDTFFTHYTRLLNSNNFVTKRQSLKLLAELLVDRTNFKIMIKFISIEGNLKLLMMLLLDKSKSIQFEAFHVFKVFVANPNKSKEIRDILSMNKKKLVKYLTGFQSDLKDESFNEEKQLIIETISNLEPSDDE
mmetsp:Transcript_5667/g.21359  ORF Transcript_5667/g.21359 Transcript_5667/m.21359 type:complete len:364 (+) Transcript_5667:710-1801(+)